MPAEASTGNDRAQAFRIHDNASEKVTTDEHQAIGTPGHPWGDAEITEWRTRQTRKRSYESDVLQRLEGLRSNFDIEQFGLLEYPPDRYPLIALRSRNWRDDLPSALITGGVHGYETSGVHGALKFAEEHAADYVGRINLLVVPCVSPWAYERVHRWNPGAIDPNRSFRENSPAPESAALMQLLAPLRDRFLMHIDLHETTDTDESEFRPSLAARDGIEYVPGEIPDGFYLVDDSETPQPKFQQAIIDAVAKVTHIAPADANGEIIGSPMVVPGVINYRLRELGLCAGITDAPYRTTTEVYPDSPRTTSAQCDAAQVAAVRAAIDFALDRNPTPSVETG
ncbi:MAG: M14 family metallocarboxypeptidase [Acidihalobacter sp.]